MGTLYTFLSIPKTALKTKLINLGKKYLSIPSISTTITSLQTLSSPTGIDEDLPAAAQPPSVAMPEETFMHV